MTDRVTVIKEDSDAELTEMQKGLLKNTGHIDGHPCESCGKGVGNMMSMICWTCCKKEHPEINQLSSIDLIRFREDYATIGAETQKTIYSHYRQDYPNADHFTKLDYFFRSVNSLIAKVLETVNDNPNEAWGYIPLDDYILEQVSVMLRELNLDIDDPKVREQLKRHHGGWMATL